MQIRSVKWKVLFLSLALTVSATAFAQSNTGKGSAPWSVASRKAELKQQSRWSLDQWLATRDRMNWMDMWLALNYPSPFEFFITGAYNMVPESQGGKADVRWGAGAYVKIFGLEFEHDTVFTPEDNLRFHLRLFGYNVQNTNLTFQAGIRFRKDPISYRQGYLGGSITIYLHKYFGIYSLYRYYLTGVSVPVVGTLNGHRFELGPFIDYGFLRIFGNYLYQRETGSTASYTAVANGWIIGGQLFF